MFKITIICKASTQVGLGHLIRTKSFIEQLDMDLLSISIQFILIGDSSLAKLICKKNVHVLTLDSESELLKVDINPVLILDLIEIDENILIEIKLKVNKIALLSPVFNCFHLIDYYFGRTKYLNFQRDLYPNLKIFSGLDYAIIQDNCKQISAGQYERNLKNENFAIAISMGGGDATNKTFSVLKALKNCKVNITIWVMIGEGYKYSYDELIEEIRNDTEHEIILAKTNRSMWQILTNCVLCILPGGITTYEAVYAGLPTINFSELESQRILLTELTENRSAFDFGIYSEQTLNNISNFIEHLFFNRKELLFMHVSTKNLIDGKAAKRISDVLFNQTCI